MDPVVNVIKNYVSLTMRQNKLERLSLAASTMFESETKCGAVRCPTRVCSSLTAK
jgi:ribosomal protein L32